MKYQIVSANPLTGSIVVKYMTDDNIDICVQNLDLVVIDGKYQTGALLEHEILSRGPLRLESRINEVKSVTNFNEIEALVVVPEGAVT